jgi:SpoVK/Ycf46/Vps4 family AAA+-type ATPase
MSRQVMDDDAETARSEKLSRRKILEKATHLKNLVLATIKTEILKYVWDDLIGQTFPAGDAYDLVGSVNEGKYNDAAKGMLFEGPPGLGKDVLANIIFYEMKGVTVFDIPHDFGARKSGIWEHLIDIAYDHSPAIIYFNECDGVFKGNTNPEAIKRAWNEGITTGGYVLMLGSTNGVTKIDDAIVNRFGDPYKFDPLTSEQRCILIKRKILGSYDKKDKAKADLESADDAEWLALADLIPVDKNPRWLVIDFIQKVKSTYNTACREKNRTTLISLKDFMDRLRKLPAPSTSDRTALATDQVDLVKIWLQSRCEAEYEAPIMHVKSLVVDLIKSGMDADGGSSGNVQLNAATLSLMDQTFNWRQFYRNPESTPLPDVFLRNFKVRPACPTCPACPACPTCPNCPNCPADVLDSGIPRDLRWRLRSVGVR